MTRKLKIAVVAAALGGLSVPAFTGEAFAQTRNWQPTVLKVNDSTPDDLARTKEENGVIRLRKTDEEFTNEMSTVAMFGDGKKGLYIEMRSSALNGTLPEHRMQGACTPIELVQATDGTVAFQKNPGERFVTDNRGNEYRNANHGDMQPINGGKNMLYMFNYQPNNGSDTIRYAKVLDSSCNEVTIKNGNGQVQKQVEIIAKNNDDLSMAQSGEGPCDIASDANGTTHLTCWAGGNGNGRDDGWLNDISVSCQNGADGAATECTIKKNFDISLCKREERSRGRCSIAADDPNTAICTWTEGNNQPQRDGTWIAAVDISADGEKGENADSRLIWKEQIEGRKELPNGERTYSSRANHARVLLAQPDGSLKKSDMLIFFSGDLEGRNNNNKKGGTYREMRFGVIKATKAGMEYVVPMQNVNDLMLGIDATHVTMSAAVFGEGASLMPGITILSGSHLGGGISTAVIKTVGLDLATKKFVDLGTHTSGAYYDRHLYSNYLGNNPGNQGRNFAGTALVKNPFAGVNGNTQAYFIASSMTGKSSETVGKPELKPSSFVSLMGIAQLAPPPAAPPAATPPPATTPPPGSGTGAGTGTGSGTGTGTGQNGTDATEPGTAESPSMFGCSVAFGGAAGSGSAILLLAGLGALYFVRRRRA